MQIASHIQQGWSDTSGSDLLLLAPYAIELACEKTDSAFELLRVGPPAHEGEPPHRQTPLSSSRRMLPESGQDDIVHIRLQGSLDELDVSLPSAQPCVHGPNDIATGIGVQYSNFESVTCKR